MKKTVKDIDIKNKKVIITTTTKIFKTYNNESGFQCSSR